jgi:hypothetical protein
MKAIAHLTVYFKDLIFKIVPIELQEDNGTLELITTISEKGTETFKFLKLPTSISSFIILNKEQLNNSVIDIRIEYHEDILPIKKTRRKKAISDVK